MNYYCINNLYSHQLKINIRNDLVEVQKRIRQNFHTANLPYGELIFCRNFRTAKYPYGEISYAGISLRRNFLTAKYPYGEIFQRRLSRLVLSIVFFMEHIIHVTSNICTCCNLRQSELRIKKSQCLVSTNIYACVVNEINFLLKFILH